MIKKSEDKLEEAKKIASKSVNKSFFEGAEENVLKLFRWISSLIDKIFFSNKYVPLFALVLACLSYFVITYDDNSSSVLLSSKILSNVAFNARYNTEVFELSGLPSACEIVLSGDAASVSNAASKKGYCQIDLEGYTEGSHTIRVSTVGYGDNINATVTPSEVTVVLKKKTTKQFDLSYDYINQNSMDVRYVLSEPEFNSGDKINIRASQDTLNSIALVKALIDVSGQTSDFTVQAPLVAYDKNGQAVNAEIVPDKVNATVKVSSPSSEVAIRLNPIGSAPNGMAIDTVQIIDHQTTRIYASESVLATISEILVDFDLSTVADNTGTEIALPLTLPNGVRASDVNVVNVKIALTTSDSRVIDKVPLNAHNNYNNLAISEINIPEVDVTVSGSSNNISLVNKDDIEVYFEMPETAGTYTLPLYVKAANHPYVNLALSQVNVVVTLVEANQ